MIQAATGRHVWVQNAGEKAHIVHSPSSRDDDPPRSLGVEHDAPGHLRLDGHGAVDAERRAAAVDAHVVGELVGARYQHDFAHRIIFERFTEFARADRVPRAELQRRQGR
eukprot:scaffold61261_cov66-Phaeocystis_antarctica.AAC.3